MSLFHASVYCQNRVVDNLETIDRLILDKSTPERIRNKALQSLWDYARPLEHATFLPIKFSLPLIRAGSSLRYVSLNPSIQKTDDGFLVICRTVNYKQKNGAIYRPIDSLDPVIRNKNFLLKYSKDMRFLWKKEIIDDFPGKKFENCPFRGLEDCRLIIDPSDSSKISMLCTTLDLHPIYLPSMALCTLQEEDHVVHTKKLVPLVPPKASFGRWEKNWLPYFKDELLHVVYSYDTFMTFKVNEKTGDCSYDDYYVPSYRFSDFRGSAPPISFDDGHLLMVHQTVPIKEHGRIYLHRFLYFNNKWIITKVSRPFTFRHMGVEFSCGMTLDHTNENLLIGVGENDEKAFIASVGVETVRSMLHALP